ncbi:MAG TPA: hypothetical protein VKA27_03010 [Sunxiuqinia sp.]|nr:hypothetical protein [Sunxiuqinia sp.]
MTKSLILVFVVSFFSQLHAQEVQTVPARFQALGDASVSIQSPLSVFSNPAGFAGNNKVCFGVNYDNRFLLKELQSSAAFLILPVHATAFGFSYSQFGGDGYREAKMALGVAKPLSRQLDAGIRFNYYRLFFPENDRNLSTLSIDVGAQYQLAHGIRIGGHAIKPYKIENQHQLVQLNYPEILRFGIQKHFDDRLLIAVEIRKLADFSPEVRCGMELNIRKQIQLRMGIESRLALFALGVGYKVKNLQTDVSFQYHQYLGYSPSFTIYYQLP